VCPGSLPHHFIVLHQDHVIGAEGCDEDDAGHPLEAVDPLLPLRALAAHVEHPGQDKVGGVSTPTPCPTPGTSPRRGDGPHLKLRSLKENWVSMMPVVLTRERSTSCSVGT